MAAASSDPYAQVEDDDYVKVSGEDGDEFMEIPKEEDDTVLLSTIQTQFPHAIGLKCKGSSGAWRAIRSVDNVLAPPKGGWGDKIYCITLSDTRKRKSEASDDIKKPSKRPSSNPLLKDMAVIGLPYKLTTEEVREYFETNCGEVTYCEVKVDRTTGKSRGFGFVRFKEIESARSAVDSDHFLEGRKVSVKPKEVKPMKLFIGRLPHEATKEMLDEHFSKYGELKDVYIPTPFRNFAFITYESSEDGQEVLKDRHVLEGSRLNVEERKPETRNDQNNQSFGRQSMSNNNSGGYMTRDYQKEKIANLPPQQHMNQPSGDLKTMLFEFLAKSM